MARLLPLSEHVFHVHKRHSDDAFVISALHLQTYTASASEEERDTGQGGGGESWAGGGREKEGR